MIRNINEILIKYWKEKNLSDKVNHLVKVVDKSIIKPVQKLKRKVEKSCVTTIN